MRTVRRGYNFLRNGSFMNRISNSNVIQAIVCYLSRIIPSSMIGNSGSNSVSITEGQISAATITTSTTDISDVVDQSNHDNYETEEAEDISLLGISSYLLPGEDKNSLVCVVCHSNPAEVSYTQSKSITSHHILTFSFSSIYRIRIDQIVVIHFVIYVYILCYQ